MTELIHPCTAPISQEFGDDFAWQGYSQFYRQHYGLQGHNGIDYAAQPGMEVYAAADGTVLFAGWGDNWDSTVGGGAYVVILDHGDILTAYLHLTAYSNRHLAGARVKQGDVIATTGNTGVGTGPHLHFQVMPKPFNRNNNWGCVNPRRYMTKVTAASGVTIKPIQEDTLSAAEVKEIKNHITAETNRILRDGPRKFWGYRHEDPKINRGHDMHWHVLNMGASILNTKIKNKKGVAYRWLSYIVNDNQNAWDNKRLIEEVAKRNGVSVAEIEAALSGVLQEEMPELLAENAVDVEVTINPKEKI